MKTVPVWIVVACLLILSAIVYLPTLRLPFIADDFVQIPLSVQYAKAGWAPLLLDPNLRTRASYMVLNALLDRTFGFTPMPFYMADIMLHFACVVGVYFLSVWTRVDKLTAFSAACFFAVFEGHNEAVMWIAAASDLLVCFFILVGMVCWLKWLYSASWVWYLAAVLSMFGAALSKESFWVMPALLALPLLVERRFAARPLLGLIPFFAAALLYIGWSFADRVSRPGYSDIRFSFHAPWFEVLLFSTARLLYPWGLVAIVILAFWRRLEDGKMIGCWLLWIIVSIVPYSFLTYMNRIPSRHTYIASVGLALLFGMASKRLREEGKTVLLSAFASAALIVNMEIIWVKKMNQFRTRAEPTELLMRAARESSGSLLIACTPLEQVVAAAAVESVGRQASFPVGGMKSEQHCFSVSYKNSTGSQKTIERQMDTQKHGAFY